MQPAEFLKLPNLKKLNAELNSFINDADYEDKLLVNWEGFIEDQYVGIGSGRNGASTLVSLKKIMHDCSAIDLVRCGDAKSDFLNIYFKANATAGQSGRQEFRRVRLKHLKTNKIHTLEDFNIEILTSKFGRVFNTVDQQVASGNVVALFKFQSTEISEQVYGDVIFNLDYHQEKVSAFFTERGYEFIDAFTYTHKLEMRVSGVKVTKNKIEIAYQNTMTYNSLPEVITIEKQNNFQALQLSELGIEGKGYYMHHDRMKILPQDRAAALEFKKRFDNLT